MCIRDSYNGIVRNGKRALNTLETIQNVLHQVFAVAVDDEYIRVNPTDGVLTAIKAAHQYETPKRHALTLPQQQAFLSFTKKTPKFQHWLPMFTFMLGTGCRISETVGLCWSDIDFESGFITIQHNLVYQMCIRDRHCSRARTASTGTLSRCWNAATISTAKCGSARTSSRWTANRS